MRVQGSRFFAALILALPSIGFAATPYTITGLFPPSGSNVTSAYAINNEDDIIGLQANFTYDPTTNKVTEGTFNGYEMTSAGFQSLPAPVGPLGKGNVTGNAIPMALNNSGAVVGAAAATLSSGASGAVAAEFSNGNFIDLGNTIDTQFNATFSIAAGINDSGEVAGVYTVPRSTSGGSKLDTFAYSEKNGVVTQLPTTPGQDSAALGINNSGTIVGFSGATSTGQLPQAFSYDGTTFTSLGDLPGESSSIATLINSSGLIVGDSGNGQPLDKLQKNQDSAEALILGLNLVDIFTALGGTQSDMFEYNPTTKTMKDLGTLGGGVAIPLAINSSGEIVGSSLDASGDFHAFIDNGTTMTDLNSLVPVDSGWTLLTASGINDQDEIVGMGSLNGVNEAYLLSPDDLVITPEGSIQTGSTSTGGSSGNGGGVSAVPLPASAYSSAAMLAALAIVGAIKSRRIQPGR